MEPKKNPNIEVGRNSSLYFAIGLNIMLLFTYGALEMKSYDKSQTDYLALTMEAEIEEDIPVTEQIKTPPPPPPPPAVTAETITVVEDVAEIEETLIESTEITQTDGIEERIIDVEEVEVAEIEEDISIPFSVVEEVPIFPGCKGNNTELRNCFQKKMQEHLLKNFRYPELALEMGIHGKVFVIFNINKEGRISNIKTRGPDKLLEEEAIRIMNLLPKMEPGKQRGVPVKVPYSLPINFVLEN